VCRAHISSGNPLAEKQERQKNGNHDIYPGSDSEGRSGYSREEMVNEHNEPDNLYAIRNIEPFDYINKNRHKLIERQGNPYEWPKDVLPDKNIDPIDEKALGSYCDYCRKK
jgi:hypothetical protein